MTYRRTQVGIPTLGGLGLAALGLAVGGALSGGRGPAAGLFAGAGVLAVLAVLFGSLTVEVDREALRIRFGPGPIRRSWPLSRVRGAEPLRCSWWWGWGIHLTPRGWLYNVAGLDAVEVRLEGGRSVLVGTDEPRELARAIRRAAGIGD